LVGAVATEREAVPLDPSKDVLIVPLQVPLYVAVNVSLPPGAPVALQLASSPLSVAVHSASVPMLKVTLPLGVPEEGVTTAEYATDCPYVDDVGRTLAVVAVAVAGLTVSLVMLLAAEKLLSPL